MKKVWVVGVLVLVLLLTATSYGVIHRASTASALGPAEVVNAYYEWYLEYIGDRGTDAMRNPLVDGAYRNSPYLAPQFITKVDKVVAGFEGGGADPFLLAQDIPTEVKVGQAVITGKTALVPVTTSFTGHRFAVSLEEAAAGQWLITAITLAR